MKTLRLPPPAGKSWDCKGPFICHHPNFALAGGRISSGDVPQLRKWFFFVPEKCQGAGCSPDDECCMALQSWLAHGGQDKHQQGCAGEQGKMKPQPQVSWEGDDRARNSRPFPCNRSQYSPHSCNPPWCLLRACSPWKLPWSQGFCLLPHSLSPWQELLSFKYPKAGKTLMRFWGGRTRDPLALFFTSEFPDFLAGKNWYSLSKPTRFLNRRSPQAGACRKPSFPPNSCASLSTQRSRRKRVVNTSGSTANF